MLKKIAIAVLFCFCVLWISACAPQREMILTQTTKETTRQATPTPRLTAAPTVQQTQKPTQTQPINMTDQDTKYLIEDNKLYKQIADEKTLIYDSTKYYETAEVFIRELFVEKDALYFIESAFDSAKHEHYNNPNYIVRVDKRGDNRKVLATSTALNGFQEFIMYQDRIIFVEENGDSVDIGDVAKDGIDQGRLDIKSYTDQYDAFTSFTGLEFEKRDGHLFAHVILYPKGDAVAEFHTLRIDEHFTIERVLPEHDQFYLGYDKVFKTKAHTDELEMIYDATEYYKDGDTRVYRLNVTDDALYFTEQGVNRYGNTMSYIISIDRDGKNRKEVCMASHIDTRLESVVYKDKLYYSERSYAMTMYDIQLISSINKDGSGRQFLDFHEYAAQHGLTPEHISIWLHIEGDILVAEVTFDIKDTHILQINEDLSYERID